ncbi:hypothetical protein O4H26_13255 [Aequorivita viscosa]|nr:hypothetical protein [Aequorivita viscosa]
MKALAKRAERYNLQHHNEPRPQRKDDLTTERPPTTNGCHNGLKTMICT